MTAPRARAATVAVMAAMSLVVLDAGMLNVALPSIGASLNLSPSEAVLAVTAYQAALIIGLLPAAHLAPRLGQRRLFAGGLALFSAASILCGFAPSLPALLCARILQGLGGAAIMALGMALLRFALDADSFSRAIGWNALNVALCSAAGPILGAVILSVAPWPWLFFAKLPVILVALVAAAALPVLAPAGRRIDGAGIALHAAIVALFLLASGMAAAWPGAALLLGATAGLLGWATLRRERRRVDPVWPVDLFGGRAFRVSVSASVCCFVAQSAGMLALPFCVQLGRGYGPLAAGGIMLCWPLAVAATSLAAGRLADRFGAALLCMTGGGVLAAGLLVMTLASAGQGLAPLAVGAALCGLGFGLFQVPNNRTMFLAAPPERSAAAGGMQGSARLIGQTIGALAIGLLLAGAPLALAPRLGLAVAALFAVAAALVSATAVAFPSGGGRTASA